MLRWFYSSMENTFHSILTGVERNKPLDICRWKIQLKISGNDDFQGITKTASNPQTLPRYIVLFF